MTAKNDTSLRTEFAPGIPKDRRVQPLPSISKSTDWKLAIQEHDAERAGKHFDFRLVDPATGHAHSWALPGARLPDPGKSVLAVPQATHTAAYALNFGKHTPQEISEGYGKGTVSMHTLTDVDVHHSDPDASEGETRLRFNIYKSTGPEEYAIVKVRGGNDLLVNKTLTRERLPHLPIGEKPKAKEKDVSKIEFDNANEVMMPKYDGAHTLLDISRANKNLNLFSYREPKRHAAGLIEHTHKVPSLLALKAPSDLKGTTFRAETIAVDKNGKAIPAKDIAGMLNATVPVSRAKQEQMGAELKPIIFDVVRYKGKDVTNKPFEERYELARQAGERLGLTVAELAKTPEEKRTLLDAIRAGKHPMTTEGVVLRSAIDDGPALKAKFRPDYDVHVRGIFEAKDKGGAGKGRAGGFEYSWSENGPVVGRIGTGLDHETARDMLANPDKYIGRVAKIEAEQKYPSGALGKPAFMEWHLDKGDLSKVADHAEDRFLRGDESGKRTNLPIEHLDALRAAVQRANAQDLRHLPGEFAVPFVDNSKAIIQKINTRSGDRLVLKTVLSPSMRVKQKVLPMSDLTLRDVLTGQPLLTPMEKDASWLANRLGRAVKGTSDLVSRTVQGVRSGVHSVGDSLAASRARDAASYQAGLRGRSLTQAQLDNITRISNKQRQAARVRPAAPEPVPTPAAPPAAAPNAEEHDLPSFVMPAAAALGGIGVGAAGMAAMRPQQAQHSEYSEPYQYRYASHTVGEPAGPLRKAFRYLGDSAYSASPVERVLLNGLSGSTAGALSGALIAPDDERLEGASLGALTGGAIGAGLGGADALYRANRARARHRFQDADYRHLLKVIDRDPGYYGHMAARELDTRARNELLKTLAVRGASSLGAGIAVPGLLSDPDDLTSDSVEVVKEAASDPIYSRLLEGAETAEIPVAKMNPSIRAIAPYASGVYVPNILSSVLEAEAQNNPEFRKGLFYKDIRPGTVYVPKPTELADASSVLAHELGHAVADRRYPTFSKAITLSDMLGAGLPYAAFGVGALTDQETADQRGYLPILAGMGVAALPKALAEGQAWYHGAPLLEEAVKGTAHGADILRGYHGNNASNLLLQAGAPAVAAGLNYGFGRLSRKLFDRAYDALAGDVSDDTAPAVLTDTAETPNSTTAKVAMVHALTVLGLR